MKIFVFLKRWPRYLKSTRALRPREIAQGPGVFLYIELQRMFYCLSGITLWIILVFKLKVKLVYLGQRPIHKYGRHVNNRPCHRHPGHPGFYYHWNIYSRPNETKAWIIGRIYLAGRWFGRWVTDWGARRDRWPQMLYGVMDEEIITRSQFHAPSIPWHFGIKQEDSEHNNIEKRHSRSDLSQRKTLPRGSDNHS